jgi:hypothetical protein
MHATISDVIADTVQNSIEAGASRICLLINELDGMIRVKISDNGKGMDEPTLARAFDPFFTESGKHDARKVGLGLPLLKQICEDCGGSLSLRSAPGAGTDLEYSFTASNIDLPPWGDLARTVVMLMNYPGDFELVFKHRIGAEEYEIAKSELVDAVGGLETVDALKLAIEFLSSQEEALK